MQIFRFNGQAYVAAEDLQALMHEKDRNKLLPCVASMGSNLFTAAELQVKHPPTNRAEDTKYVLQKCANRILETNPGYFIDDVTRIFVYDKNNTGFVGLHILDINATVMRSSVMLLLVKENVKRYDAEFKPCVNNCKYITLEDTKKVVAKYIGYFTKEFVKLVGEAGAIVIVDEPSKKHPREESEWVMREVDVKKAKVCGLVRKLDNNEYEFNSFDKRKRVPTSAVHQLRHYSIGQEYSVGERVEVLYSFNKCNAWAPAYVIKVGKDKLYYMVLYVYLKNDYGLNKIPYTKMRKIIK